jgi:hypothetical protein
MGLAGDPLLFYSGVKLQRSARSWKSNLNQLPSRQFPPFEPN